MSVQEEFDAFITSAIQSCIGVMVHDSGEIVAVDRREPLQVFHLREAFMKAQNRGFESASSQWQTVMGQFTTEQLIVLAVTSGKAQEILDLRLAQCLEMQKSGRKE